jgi:hypothetical protein
MSVDKDILNKTTKTRQIETRKEIYVQERSARAGLIMSFFWVEVDRSRVRSGAKEYHPLLEFRIFPPGQQRGYVGAAGGD